jgi:hypothetical protein
MIILTANNNRKRKNKKITTDLRSFIQFNLMQG